MKLTNQQIDSIVNKANREANLEHAKAKKEFMAEQTKKHTPTAKKYLSAIKSIPLELKIGYNDVTFDTILKQLIEYEKEPVKQFCERDFRDKVVIASIDASDIKELEKALGIKLA